MEHRKKKQRKRFRHLRQADRDRMEAMLASGMKQKDIAAVLKVDPSTVSREMKRKKEDGRYDAANAEMKANRKRLSSKRKGMKVESDPRLRAYVVRGLRQKRSPDEISGRMKLDKTPFYATKNAIYAWLYSVYGQRYCKHLCTRRWKPKPQKKKAAREAIPNRKSIEKRPLGATNKSRYGHFEADTVHPPKRAGTREALAVAAEMKTKLLLGTKAASLAPKEMTRAIRKIGRGVKMLSLTLDNGLENREHEKWDAPAFFADPHSPWQKPLVENNIGLVRRWHFPKGTDWSKVGEDKLQGAIAHLNHKYRRSLGYRSAIEVAMAHGIIKKQRKNSRAG
jgi:IS30 family transposase